MATTADDGGDGVRKKLSTKGLIIRDYFDGILNVCQVFAQAVDLPIAACQLSLGEGSQLDLAVLPIGHHPVQSVQKRQPMIT